MDAFRRLMEVIGTTIDGIGVLIMVIGMLTATFRFLLKPAAASYRVYRQDAGRSILLGLEFLVAGDIIRTVVVSPTPQNVLVLAIIVLIRTFLSFTLQLELEGRLTWRHTGPQQ